MHEEEVLWCHWRDWLDDWIQEIHESSLVVPGPAPLLAVGLQVRPGGKPP